MNLTAENVHRIFTDCLFTTEEVKAANGNPSEAVLAEGISISVGFHPERLRGHREEIASMLSELPENFMESKGGWSFLMACNTRNNVQWGEHRNMQELFLLGIGLGMVRSLTPREHWEMLPRGMPYYVVNTQGFDSVLPQ